MFDAHEFATRLAERKDRWSLLKDFVAEWHSPLQDADGYPVEELDAAEQRLGLKLPIALREWYQLAGKREDIVATQNNLVCPEELEIKNGLLVFHSENQDVVEWGIRPSDLELPDPPVYLNDSGMHTTAQEPIRENGNLSEFVLQMLVLETTWFAGFGRSASADAGILEIVQSKFRPLGFPKWHWPDNPSQLYGGGDVLIDAGTSHDGSEWICLSACNRPALIIAAQEFNVAWKERDVN